MSGRAAPPRRRLPAVGARPRHRRHGVRDRAAAYGRSTYKVTFDEDGNVVMSCGRQFLWFEPTVEAVYVYDREQIDETRSSSSSAIRVHQRRRRRSLPQLAELDDDDHDDDDHDHHDDHNDDDEPREAPTLRCRPRPARRRRRRRTSTADRRWRPPLPRPGPPFDRAVLVVMAGMITAIAYTFASLGQYTQIPARIIPSCWRCSASSPTSPCAGSPAAPSRRCSPSSPCSTASAT